MTITAGLPTGARKSKLNYAGKTAEFELEKMPQTKRGKRLLAYALAALGGYVTAVTLGQGAGLAVFLTAGVIFELLFWKTLLIR